MAAYRHTLLQAVVAAAAILLSFLLWSHSIHIQHAGVVETIRSQGLVTGNRLPHYLSYSGYARVDNRSWVERSLHDGDDTWPYENAWERNVTIGSWLVCMMNAPLDSVIQSKWTDEDELKPYGWSVRSASWYRFSASHDRLTTHDLDEEYEIDYEPTNALYGNTLNPGDGVILAESNAGPDYRNWIDNLGLAPNEIVPLKQWSDVVFLHWQDLHLRVEDGAYIRRLKHAFRHHVTNRQTLDAMRAVMARESPPRQVPPPAWPGIIYHIRDEAAKVLMNTPNAGGIVWLLAQHKERLGIRIVDEVRMFSSGDPGQQVPNLYFHIVAGPLPAGQLGRSEDHP